MSTASAVHEVFLSYDASDSDVAELVARAFSEAGHSVFLQEPGGFPPKSSDPIREAITESSVVVAIVSRATLRSTWQTIEIGAAMGWELPVYLLLKGVTVRDVPDSLRKFPAFPVSKIADLVKAVSRELQSGLRFQNEDRDVLCHLYAETGIQLDELAIQYAELEQLARKFNQARGSDLASDKLLQELFRLRKRKELPPLRGRRRGNTGSASA